MSNNCRPALDTRPIVVVIQVMERGAIRAVRITTVFLHSLEEAWQTVHPAAFITTTRPAPKNIP